MAQDDLGIICVCDPMCAWCWGFSPVLDRLHATFGGRAPLTVIMGGLHAGDTMPMDEAYKAEIRGHWQDVAKRTGQTFAHEFFEREGFVLDSEPACRAAVAVRRLDPAVLLDYIRAIQEAFHARNEDTTDRETLRGLAVALGVDGETFVSLFESEEIRTETAGDFSLARQLGAMGFPTILLRRGDEAEVLCVGYRPFGALRNSVERWLKGE